MRRVYSCVHVILATFGTDGDVYPYIGLGRVLVQRGHEVTLASSPHYAPLAECYGFQFENIIEGAEIDRVLWNPDFWHPLKAGQLAAKWGLKFLREQYSALEQLVKRERCILVANPGLLAARLVHETSNVPFVSLVLQPWLLPSVHRPVAIPMVGLPRGAPRWLWRLQIELLHRFSDRLIGPQVNAFRRTLGLPPVRYLLKWWFSPQCVLGMFPEWYGPPQPDWPSQVQLLSFPVFDGTTGEELTAGIERFLQSGSAPVAITFGTGIRHAKELYRAAVDAVRQCGRRAVVITKYAEQAPDQFFKDVIVTGYAPFSRLFPRCAAIIHHGGIGTTARALLANVPQLIVPVCFDQLDNALRVQALERGSLVRLRAANASRMAKELQRVLRLPPLRQIQNEDGGESSAYEDAVTLLERRFL